MTIGVFDSGIGGLSVHHALVRRLPQADFIYLADQANTPYGGRSGEEIVELTKAGCIRLFDEGCSLVILACNTAAAIALRRLQQTWLPGYRREIGRPVNILGLIVPTIEAATGVDWEDEKEFTSEKIEKVDILGIFSTQATAASRVYEIEIDKRRHDLAVFSEPCPTLAAQIEQGAGVDVLAPLIQTHVENLRRKIGRHPNRAILGCTHYEIVASLFRTALPPGTPLIHQPAAVADAIGEYLESHPEYDPGHSGLRRFLTTGDPGEQNGLVAAFWGGPLRFERA